LEFELGAKIEDFHRAEDLLGLDLAAFTAGAASEADMVVGPAAVAPMKLSAAFRRDRSSACACIRPTPAARRDWRVCGL